MVRKQTGDLEGWISLEGGVIRHISDSCGVWQLSVEDILLIAEETDESGPYGEDWRIVFAASTPVFHAASISADGMMAVLAELASGLGVELVPELAASTTFASRILYPTSSSGAPLYDYLEKKTWREWIWPAPVRTELTDHAKEILQLPASKRQVRD